MNYYDVNILDYIDPAIALSPMFPEWLIYVEDILLSREFQKRKYFLHHYNLSVWDHSILVSFTSFKVAKYFGFNARIAAIAGLLHDFYPNAWLYSDDLAKIDDGKYVRDLSIKKPLFKKHGFTHGYEASQNVIKYFPEYANKRILNSIRYHMFPLVLIPPRYREGVVITMVDKLNSVRELPSVSIVFNKASSKVMGIFCKKS